MVDHHRARRVAVATALGVLHAVAVATHLLDVVALRAAEDGDAQVGDELAHAGDHALDADQLVDGVGGEIAHCHLLLEVVHARLWREEIIL